MGSHILKDRFAIAGGLSIRRKAYDWVGHFEPSGNSSGTGTDTGP